MTKRKTLKKRNTNTRGTRKNREKKRVVLILSLDVALQPQKKMKILHVTAMKH